MPSQVILQTSSGTSLIEYIIAGNASAAVPQMGLQNTLVQISAAQFKNATASPVVLIPAPGPNLAIVPISCTIQLNFNTTAYTTDPNPTIGFGTNAADVFGNGWMMYPQIRMEEQSSNTFCFSTVTSSGQGAGTFNPSTHVVNQPLYWVNENSMVGNAGDGTFTVNIQWLEINVTTGAIVNGTPAVFGSMINLSTAQLQSLSPIQLIAAPGTNKMIIPLSLIEWNHFNTTGYSVNGTSEIGYGSVLANINATNVMPCGPGSASNDTILMVTCSLASPNAPNVGPVVYNTPSNFINQPLSFVNNPAAPPINAGDETATLYLQYAILDTVAGTLTTTTGNFNASFTSLTASQIANASATAVQLVPTGGPNTVQFPVSSVVESFFNTTPFSHASGGVPNPTIGTGFDANDFISDFITLFFVTELFTQSNSQIAITAPATSQFDNPTNLQINVPILYGDTAGTITPNTADSTGNVMVQYLTIDLNTGNILS